MAHSDDLTTIDLLKDILKRADFWLGDDGQVYAKFMQDDRNVTYATTSRDFINWLTGVAVTQLCFFPSGKILNQAISDIEQRARLEPFAFPVANRIYSDDISTSIDLGNGRAVEINAANTAIDEDLSVIFPTRHDREALPAPESANVFEVLPPILNLPEHGTLVALIFLMSCLRQEGHYPILVVSGPPQSGKSRLARNMRRLLDPTAIPLRPLPKTRDELNAMVIDNAILGFDNVETIPGWLEEDLLALAKGTSLRVHAYSRPVQYKRPTILVCNDLPDAPALLENAVVVRLKQLPVAEIKNQRTLDRQFQDTHAKAFGSLVELCRQAYKCCDQVKLTKVHKDAALERWILAVDDALGLSGKLLAAFGNNLEQTLALMVNEKPALCAFYAMVKSKGSVKATATQLLHEIEAFLDGPKDVRYPTSGKAFAKLLRDHKRYMPDIEIEFDVLTGKNRDRNIVVTWVGNKTVQARRPSATANGKTRGKGDGKDGDNQPTLFL